MAASDNGLEELQRISKGGLTWNDLYDLTNWMCKLQNRGNFLHWNVDDTILKRSGEFCLFRFVWNKEIKQIRVTQIVLHKNCSV